MARVSRRCRWCRSARIKRTSADQPHFGQVIVNGVIQAQGMQAQDIQAERVNADNYFFHRIPLAPLMRSVPGVSAADQLRLQQMQQDQQNAAAQDKPRRREIARGRRRSQATSEDAATPPAE